MFKNKNKITENVTCVILAAGASTRMGENKLFIPIDDENRPVLAYTIQNVSRCKQVSDIIIVTQSHNIKHIQDIVKTYNFVKVKKIVKGGKTRQESCFCGAKEVDSSTDMLLIHDGARPFIDANKIKNLIDDVKRFKAATLGVMAKDTVKKLDENGFIKTTLNRGEIVNIHTPQGFSYSLYMSAMEHAIKNQLDYTDDAQLMENIGIKVFVTDDDYSNIKITVPDDLVMARGMIKA